MNLTDRIAQALKRKGKRQRNGTGLFNWQRKATGERKGSFVETGKRTEHFPRTATATLYEDEVYGVAVYEQDEHGITHITIQRKDGGTVRDWRDLQQIKTDLIGAEREACEIFPAESRLVDMRNTYHLWALPPDKYFAFGFREGRLTE